MGAAFNTTLAHLLLALQSGAERYACSQRRQSASNPLILLAPRRLSGGPASLVPTECRRCSQGAADHSQ